jgi:hypothetical protein
MANEKSLRVKLILGATKGRLVRFSHLHVFTPRLNTESGKEDYSTAVLIPKTNTEDIAAVRKAIEDLKKDEWLSKGKKLPPNFWNPLRDGDTDTKQNGDPLAAECRGHFVINAKTGAHDNDGNALTPPDVMGIVRDANGKLLRITSRDVKSGDWGRVGIHLGAYTKGNGGVGVYLTNVQKVQEGEALSSHASGDDDFGQFDDDVEDELLS